jgi:hypothetical protein
MPFAIVVVFPIDTQDSLWLVGVIKLAVHCRFVSMRRNRTSPFDSAIVEDTK